MRSFQARAARAILRLTIRDVAAAVGVSPNTISRLEDDNDYRQHRVTVEGVRRFYESRGIVFEGASTFYDEDVGRMFEELKA